MKTAFMKKQAGYTDGNVEGNSWVSDSEHASRRLRLRSSENTKQDVSSFLDNLDPHSIRCHSTVQSVTLIMSEFSHVKRNIEVTYASAM